MDCLVSAIPPASLPLPSALVLKLTEISSLQQGPCCPQSYRLALHILILPAWTETCSTDSSVPTAAWFCCQAVLLHISDLVGLENCSPHRCLMCLIFMHACSWTTAMTRAGVLAAGWHKCCCCHDWVVALVLLQQLSRCSCASLNCLTRQLTCCGVVGLYV